ncbi:CDGP domain-containing protein [Mycolicibacterium vaccae]|uniref:CDGP domain-containing protein n=1 Tax=Mycolicibacterium vaccae TaxID=1810 RepID=UPI003CF8A20D
MKRTKLAAGAAAMLMVGGGLVFAAPASAQCVGQNVTFAGHGGGRCDHPPGPDGSFTRCDTVTVFGFSSTNCYQVPPGTP